MMDDSQTPKGPPKQRRRRRTANGDSPEIFELKSQIAGLTVLVRSVLSEREVSTVSVAEREKVAAEKMPLESVANERERILSAWAAEPQVKIFIAPDENDTRIRDEKVARGLSPEFPSRIFQVNGVKAEVPVGRQATVPESIAAMYEYMLNPWAAQMKLPPLTFEQVEARLGAA